MRAQPLEPASWHASASSPGSNALAELGYDDPAQVLRWLSLVRTARSYVLLAPAEQRQVDRLVSRLLTAAARCSEPDAALRGSLDLLERLQRWPGYLTVLETYPGTLSRLVALVGASPWLARFLLTHADLVDELIAGQYLRALPSRSAMQLELQHMLDACADEDAQLIVLRQFKHSRVLHILSLDLEGLLTLEEVSTALSELAGVLIETVLARVSERSGLGTAPPIGIIGYGKLGSREMSYASDTDIVFVYDGTCGIAEAQLARLARAVDRWLTTPTPAGILYATDFRLRPYGSSGLIVSSLTAVREYQLERAWTWEHQALTRARWIAGDAALGCAFEALRREVLLRARERDSLRDDVLAMRERIHASHPGTTDGFNVKHSRGGVIDIEFGVQYLVLRHAPHYPQLVTHTDNASVLADCSALRLLPEALAAAVCDAFQQYRAWMHRERLRGNETVTVSSAIAEPHVSRVLEFWSHLFGAPAIQVERTPRLTQVA